MKLTNIANFKTIDEYVNYKSTQLRSKEQTFFSIFELMFSEETNTFWESNDGYRIIKKTYGEVKKEILKRAYSLQEKLGGLEKCSVIGLYMQNNLNWIEMFWSILICGYNPLLLNTRLDKKTLNDACISANAKIVISDGELFDIKTYLADEIIIGSKENDNKIFGEEILLMTSGTSNSVKICSYDAVSIINQILNAEQIVKTNKLIKKHYEGELKLLTFLPFYHIFGLTAMYLWFAFYSRTFVYLKDMSSQCILNTIRRHKVTHIFAVPLFWNMVYDQAIKKVKERGEKTFLKLQKGLKISTFLSPVPFLNSWFQKKAFKEVREKLFGESICFMITGGGCIKEEVLKFFNGIGYHLTNGYGMSEIGITSVELSENHKILNSGTIGKPMASVEYKINEEGELLVKGESLCKYYIENNNKIYINNDWFTTKDLVTEDKGRFYLLGRKDDLIVSVSGENINPNLYERSFNIKNVKDVCIIDTQKNAQTYPVLLVSVSRYLSSDTCKLLIKEIKEKLKELNLESEIKEVILVGENLIKDKEFKLNRKRLTEEYKNGILNILTFTDVVHDNYNFDKIEKQVAICFEKVLNKTIDINSDFFADAGGTSLEYFTLITYIQEEFEIIIPLGNEKKLTSISDFSVFIKENM